MALEKAIEILKYADQQKKCVVGFDAFNYESIKWIIDTAEQEKIPVIIMIYPGDKKIISFSTFAAITRDLAAKATVPVALMLDHGPDFASAMEAVKGGFSSMMIDTSHLDFEENVRQTAEVVKACHALGIDVEGELGHVGIASRESDYKNTDNFTRVDKAVEFIERTGVDILAISIGTAHGNYISAPKLDLERLEKINAATDTPLVLHGGTGVPEDQLKEAFARGINKLNYATGYNLKLYEVAKSVMDAGTIRPRMSDLILAMEDPMRDFIRSIMRLAWPK
jgi:ketose-bisphosphate aldolase